MRFDLTSYSKQYVLYFLHASSASVNTDWCCSWSTALLCISFCFLEGTFKITCCSGHIIYIGVEHDTGKTQARQSAQSKHTEAQRPLLQLHMLLSFQHLFQNSTGTRSFQGCIRPLTKSILKAWPSAAPALPPSTSSSSTALKSSPMVQSICKYPKITRYLKSGVTVALRQ